MVILSCFHFFLLFRIVTALFSSSLTLLFASSIMCFFENAKHMSHQILHNSPFLETLLTYLSSLTHPPLPETIFYISDGKSLVNIRREGVSWLIKSSPLHFQAIVNKSLFGANYVSYCMLVHKSVSAGGLTWFSYYRWDYSRLPPSLALSTSPASAYLSSHAKKVFSQYLSLAGHGLLPYKIMFKACHPFPQRVIAALITQLSSHPQGPCSLPALLPERAGHFWPTTPNSRKLPTVFLAHLKIQ